MRRVEAPYPVAFVTPARMCVQYGEPASSRLTPSRRRLAQRRGLAGLQVTVVASRAASRDVRVQTVEVVEDVFEGADHGCLELHVALTRRGLESTEQFLVLLGVARHGILQPAEAPVSGQVHPASEVPRLCREAAPQNSAGLGALNRMGSHARIFLLRSERSECGVVHFLQVCERLSPFDFSDLINRGSVLGQFKRASGLLGTANSTPGKTPHLVRTNSALRTSGLNLYGVGETPLPKIELDANGGPHAVPVPCLPEYRPRPP